MAFAESGWVIHSDYCGFVSMNYWVSIAATYRRLPKYLAWCFAIPMMGSMKGSVLSVRHGSRVLCVIRSRYWRIRYKTSIIVAQIAIIVDIVCNSVGNIASERLLAERSPVPTHRILYARCVHTFWPAAICLPSYCTSHHRKKDGD